MKQPLALRFDRIIKENLPKRKKMMDVLMESALEANLFYEKGMGVRSILKQTGRLTDFKGIYGFIDGNKIVYIDESAYVIRRIVRQFKGNSKYQMKLAHTVSAIKSLNNSSFNTQDALVEMRKMKVIFMDVPDDLERQVTALYLQCQYECIYNRFE